MPRGCVVVPAVEVAKCCAGGAPVVPRDRVQHGQRYRPLLRSFASSALETLEAEEWDLDHRDDRRGWLGSSHRACNRSTSKSR
jgi:hypothetical protein